MKKYAQIKQRALAAYCRMEAGLAALERSAAVRRVIFFSLLLVIGATMYLFNVHMPQILDDFDFGISWSTGLPLADLADICRSWAAHYVNWGGRLLQIFSMLSMYWGKQAFNVVNTVMYVLLLLEIYAIAAPKCRYCWSLLLAAHMILLTMVPFFGTVFLWLTGACNYLFGTVIALIPLVILRGVREWGGFFRSRLFAVACLPLGIWAGWTNENTTLGVIALVFVALAADALEGRRVYRRLWLMWIGQCAGALVLLLAPGNFSRASIYQYDSMLIEYLRRFAFVTGYSASYLGLLLAAVLLVGAGLVKGKRRASYAGLLVFGALTACYALVGSPELSDRSFTAPIVMVLAALLVLLGDAQEHLDRFDSAKMAALPLLFMVLVYTSYHGLKDIRAYESAWGEQIAAIEEAVLNGESVVGIQSIESDSRFTMDILLNDDASVWPNTAISKAYGIDVVGL